MTEDTDMLQEAAENLRKAKVLLKQTIGLLDDMGYESPTREFVNNVLDLWWYRCDTTLRNAKTFTVGPS